MSTEIPLLLTYDRSTEMRIEIPPMGVSLPVGRDQHRSAAVDHEQGERVTQLRDNLAKGARLSVPSHVDATSIDAARG